MKETLSLPKSNFPMQAKLTTLEPKILAYWQRKDLYSLLSQRKGQKFSLHFGPPYSNGNLHLGHGLNVILKDIFLRNFAIYGCAIENYTGFDCHGLPIELAVEKNCAKDDRENFIKECGKFADYWIQQQRKTHEQLGLLRDENYYTTKENLSNIYHIFSQLVLNNRVFSASKPVAWSIATQTVVAESEIEYRDKESAAVCVAFPLLQSPLKGLEEFGYYIPIWTTTPWSLLDNTAIAYSAQLTYAICEENDKLFFIAEDRLNDFMEKTGIKLVVGKVSGSILAGSYCGSPLRPKVLVPLVASTHVKADEGTGFVHIAPSHGMEDFELVPKYNLEVRESVSVDGYFEDPSSPLNNKHIFRDEEEILKNLEGYLLYEEKVIHSYPFERRSNTPIIYRLSQQIFLELPPMDEIRHAMNDVITMPKSLKKSFLDCLANRKEWCVSRNRLWGVPLAIFLEKKTGQVLVNEKLQLAIEEQMRIDPLIFLSKEGEKILHGIIETPQNYELYIGILDVWFDSGCVSQIVTSQSQSAGIVCYLEGRDQIRAWFQTSLLVNLLGNKPRPYDMILSHGFVVDENGYKMSKSKGNVVNIQDLLREKGSEILRLWVCGSDFTDDVPIGESILQKAEQNYRKIRNVMRYLISVCESAKTTEAPYGFLEKVFIQKLNKIIDEWQGTLQGSFDGKDCLNIHKLFLDIMSFIHELSSIYFNARKDVLYCNAIHNQERIGVVKAMRYILEKLNILISTFLPFTAEEIFLYMKEVKGDGIYGGESIVLCTMHRSSETYEAELSQYEEDAPLIQKVNVLLDALKKDGKISQHTDLLLTVEKSTMPLEAIGQIFGFSKVVYDGKIEINIMEEIDCKRCHKRGMGEICNRCAEALQVASS